MLGKSNETTITESPYNEDHEILLASLRSQVLVFYYICSQYHIKVMKIKTITEMNAI